MSDSDKKSNPKPLPQGYICKACGSDSHSIHDCPRKISKSNPKASASTTTPSSSSKQSKSEKIKKIYISGLPYDTTKASIKELLESDESNPCFISYVNLVCFEDNASKCNGQAFVTLKDQSSVDNALLLNGKNMGKTVLKVQKVRIDNTSSAENTSSLKKKRCYRCGADHDPSTCNNPRICYRCKSTDHISTMCPQKKNKV